MKGGFSILSRRRPTFSLSDLFSHSLTSVVLVALLVVGGYHSYQMSVEQKRDCRLKEAELRAIEQQIREAEVQNAILQRKRDRLMTAEGIEETAREKLGMVRKGEIAYVVQPGPPEAAPLEPVTPPAPPPPEPGFLEKMLGRVLF